MDKNYIPAIEELIDRYFDDANPWTQEYAEKPYGIKLEVAEAVADAISEVIPDGDNFLFLSVVLNRLNSMEVVDKAPSEVEVIDPYLPMPISNIVIWDGNDDLFIDVAYEVLGILGDFSFTIVKVFGLEHIVEIIEAIHSVFVWFSSMSSGLMAEFWGE